MRLEVLLSCMNRKENSIISDSKITSDVLIVNQCERVQLIDELILGQRVRRIDTLEKGLSNSRNMAIENASGDICLFCDDDEEFEENYDLYILEAYQRLPDADIIIFRMKNQPCGLKRKVYRLRYLHCLKVSSWQISFRRESIVDSKIKFDPLMGAGSGNGCGEENKFLLDCYRCGMKIYHVPVEIASVNHVASTWFEGYDRVFFYQRGSATRYMLGFSYSFLYALYYTIKKRKLYKKQVSSRIALLEMLKGIFHNNIYIQKQKGVI